MGPMSGVCLSLGLLFAAAGPLLAQSSATSTGSGQDSAARPYPFGVFRLDALNNYGPDTRGWNILTPQNSYPGPAHQDPSRTRYGLPPLGGESEQPLPPATPSTE